MSEITELAYAPILVILCYRAFILIKMELENIIDYVISNKTELSKKVEEWKEQKFKAKTNEEYFLILKRIEVGEAILITL